MPSISRSPPVLKQVEQAVGVFVRDVAQLPHGVGFEEVAARVHDAEEI